jgi:hypothetical protein
MQGKENYPPMPCIMFPYPFHISITSYRVKRLRTLESVEKKTIASARRRRSLPVLSARQLTPGTCTSGNRSLFWYPMPTDHWCTSGLNYRSKICFMLTAPDLDRIGDLQHRQNMARYIYLVFDCCRHQHHRPIRAWPAMHLLDAALMKQLPADDPDSLVANLHALRLLQRCIRLPVAPSHRYIMSQHHDIYTSALQIVNHLI